MTHHIVFTIVLVAGCFPAPNAPPAQPASTAPTYDQGMAARNAMVAQQAALGIKQAEVVPASQAPAPTPGHGYSCFDFQEVTAFDVRGSERKSVAARDQCERKLETCQQAAHRYASDRHDEGEQRISYEVGSCTAQATGWCTYWFSKTAFACYRTQASCKTHLGRQALVGPNGDNRQTECAEYH